MTILKSIAVFALALIAASCSTATITLQSTPAKADIYATPLGGKPKLIGVTPLSIRAPELEKEYSGTGPFYLEFRKDGYTSARTIITDLGAIDLTVSMDLPATTGLEDQDKLNAVVDAIFESQRLARAGRQGEALAQLRVVEKLAPQLAATYELEGGIFYLQKKYKDALDAYTTAVKANPKNAQSIRMRNLLEANLGTKAKESR